MSTLPSLEPILSYLAHLHDYARGRMQQEDPEAKNRAYSFGSYRNLRRKRVLIDRYGYFSILTCEGYVAKGFGVLMDVITGRRLVLLLSILLTCWLMVFIRKYMYGVCQAVESRHWWGVINSIAHCRLHSKYDIEIIHIASWKSYMTIVCPSGKWELLGEMWKVEIAGSKLGKVEIRVCKYLSNVEIRLHTRAGIYGLISLVILVIMSGTLKPDMRMLCDSSLNKPCIG